MLREETERRLPCRFGTEPDEDGSMRGYAGSMPVVTGDTRVSLFAPFDSPVLRLVITHATGDRKEQILLVDELVARIVGRRMHSAVHPDSVAGTRFYTKSAEDAAQLVDDEPLRVLLITLALLVSLVVARLDMNALSRTSRGTTKTGNAAR